MSRPIRSFILNREKYFFCKLVFIIALGLIPVFFFSVGKAKAGNDKPLEKVILQLTWYHEFQFAGYYAAQLKGFYQEEGLEVEIRERKPGLLPVDAVLSGDADFGNATSDIMLLRMQGKPVVALAVIMQHSPWVLLVRADSGITVPEDLIGKTVSMDMSYRDVEIEAMFKNENISTGNMTVVRKEPGVENLINGTVDARVSYMTSQPFDLQKQGFEARVLRPINYGIDFYGDTLFTTERQIRDHPQRVAAFRRASLRGWQYAMEHPEELIDYIYSTYYADQTKATMPYSSDHFHFEAKIMAEDLIHPKLIDIGHMNPHRWRHIADTYAALGMAEPIDTIKGFIYDPSPRPDYKWVRWAVGIVVAILLTVGICAVILFVFNRRLRHVVRLRTSELTKINKTLAQEVSERKITEEKYRRLIENLQDNYFFYVHNTEGVFTYISPSLTNILGYSAEEFLTHYSEYLTENPINKKVLKHSELSMQGIKQPLYEVELYHKDGTIRSLQVQEVPLFDENRKVIAVEGIAQDITESKRADKDLRESERKYRTLFERSADAVLVIEGDNFVDCNSATVKMLGYKNKKELLNTHPSQLSPPLQPDGQDSFGKANQMMARAFDKGSNRFEWDHQRKNGEVFPVEVLLTSIPFKEGNFLYVVWRDITERKQTEKELENYRKHLEKLVKERTLELERVHAELVRKERMAALGQLIATVSHEIRNPLGTIRNSVYSIGDAIDKNEMGLVDRALKLAERNITRCNRIINELLDYSRKREIMFERTEIDSWLNGVLDELEFPKEVECVRELRSGITLAIDREYMRRAVENVVTNAVQALLEGNPGRNRLTVESIKAGECLELRFTDTGPGISDEIRKKIFEPLFSTKSFGVGLGVPIVKNIMEEHQGEVRFQSEVDNGTVVSLSLPIHKLEEKR